MRDPLRIPRILNMFQTIWQQYPDLRFGQLFDNIIEDIPEKFNLESSQFTFNMEDDHFERTLELWFRDVLDDQQRNRDNAAGRSSHAD